MKVNAIESNNKKSCLIPMAEGALIGSAAGYVLKGTYPVTPQEKQTPEYRRVMREIRQKKTQFGPENEAYLNSIKAKQKLSPAQDTFVKMYDGLKEGDRIHFGKSKLKSIYDSLAQKDKAAAQEFQRLILDAKMAAEKTTQRCINGYNSATKEIRPLSFFLTGGAVVGALIALAHDILRTNVKH